MATKQKIPIVKEGDFQKVIGEAFSKKRHVSYLKKVLKDFELYKKTFDQVFASDNSSDEIYLFRFKYVDKHLLWRDIAIYGWQTLCNLAETLIESLGWDNDHMHGFSLKKYENKPLNRYNNFSIYSPGWEDDPHPTFKTNEIEIANIDWTKYPKWNFVFDFGDSHEFDVEIKPFNPKSIDKDWCQALPLCIDQRGVAPIQYPPCDDPDEWEFDPRCPHCNDIKNKVKSDLLREYS